MALSSGQSFTQIATDGGLLPRPVRRVTISLFPFEPVEVIVDFSEVPVGFQVILRNEAEFGRTGQIMLFNVARQEPDPSTVAPELRPLEGPTRDQPRRQGISRWAWTW